MTGDRLKFSDVFSVLNDMRAKGVIGKYAVGGASAVAFYAEPIATKDLDIFFLFEPPQETAILSLESIYKYCRENGLTYDHEFISIRGWLVQFVECGNDPLRCGETPLPTRSGFHSRAEALMSCRRSISRQCGRLLRDLKIY